MVCQLQTPNQYDLRLEHIIISGRAAFNSRVLSGSTPPCVGRVGLLRKHYERLKNPDELVTWQLLDALFLYDDLSKTLTYKPLDREWFGHRQIKYRYRRQFVGRDAVVWIAGLPMVNVLQRQLPAREVVFSIHQRITLTHSDAIISFSGNAASFDFDDLYCEHQFVIEDSVSTYLPAARIEDIPLGHIMQLRAPMHGEGIYHVFRGSSAEREFLGDCATIDEAVELYRLVEHRKGLTK